MVIVDNFTKVRNDVFLVMCYLSGAEVKIFFWIYRQTEGYGKKSDGISISQFSEKLGISETQVKVAIKKLKDKKLIKVKAQTNKNGAKYFNRYEINYKTVETLSRKTANGTAKTDQGVSRKTAKGTSETDYTKYNNTKTKENNTKYNNTKRESNTSVKNVFFSLHANNRDKFLDKFINHLIADSEYIKSETAFKIKIRKLFAKEDKEQLEEFEKWYLKTECNRLHEIYKGSNVSFNGVDTYIESIYPYFDTDRYDKEDKLYIWLKFINSDEDFKTLHFVNADEAETFLKENSLQSEL